MSKELKSNRIIVPIDPMILKQSKQVQEPLDLFNALPEEARSPLEQKVIWWVLAKMSQLQSLYEEKVPDIPDRDLAFRISVKELYVEPRASEVDDADESQTGKKWVRGVMTNYPSYSKFKKLADKMTSRKVSVDHMNIPDPDAPQHMRRVVGSMVMFPNVFYQGGVLYIQLNRLIVPAMCTLSRGYVKYELLSAMRLGLSTSQLLYTRLSRYADKHLWRVPLLELKERLGGTNYTVYKDFKKRILEPAVTEVNERTNLAVSYVEVREGRSIVRIDFTINQRDSQNQLAVKELRKQVEEEVDEIIKWMPLQTRRTKSQELLQTDYQFTKAQEKQIIENEGMLNKFIELDYKIRNGLINVKATPTRYIASVLFAVVKQGNLFG